MAAASEPPVQESRRFVWPPRPVEVLPCEVPGAVAPDRPAPGPLVRQPPPVTTGWRQGLREVERVWLGLSTPPLADRIADAGWAPDPVQAYCPRCGSTVGPGEADASGCPICGKARLPWERLIRLGEFEGLLRDLVHEVKFTRWRRLGHDLGRLLGAAVGEQLGLAGVGRQQVLVVPMGCSWLRRMSRGIDHALVIARGVAAELDVEVAPILERSYRPTQTDLPRSQRRANVAGSIRLRRGGERLLGGKTVVLVDDVTTTRATLGAACRGLRGGSGAGHPEGQEAQTRIWAAVLAVTPDPGRRRRKIAGEEADLATTASSAE